MRLVFFDFTINYGGGPQYMVHLAELLSREHEVHIIDAYGYCQPYLEAIKQAGLMLHILCPESHKVYIGTRGIQRAFRFVSQLPNLRRIRTELKKAVAQIKPDAMWVMNEKSLTLIRSCLSFRRIPVLFFVLGWSRFEKMSFRFRWSLKRWASGIVGVSTATCKELQKVPIPSNRLFLGSMTIDFERIQASAQKIPPDLPESPLRPRLLLLAARPTYEKGHHVAYKALARLKEKGYNPALWMTGKTATGAGNEYVRYLSKLTNDLQIEQNLFFLGWQDNIPGVIQACDIGILPSYTEGFPRVCLETMLLKKPVIATSVGGIEDSVKHKKTGLIVPAGDDQALADAICLIMQNSSLREELISNAYEYIHTHFSPDKHQKNIMNIFNMVMRDSEGPKKR